MSIRVILVLALMAVIGCSQQEKTGGGGQQSSVFDRAEAVALDGSPVTLAGITFRPPASWRDLGPSGMRKADYAFGPIASEADSANVAVFYFGPNSGGGVMDNINRWVGQMSGADGAPVGQAATRREFAVSGMKAHTVEVTGTYNASMGPMSGSGGAQKADYLMVAAVIEGPEGNLFFKLTGPKQSAAEMASGFASLIHSVKLADSDSL